jgi:hypothetical protein
MQHSPTNWHVFRDILRQANRDSPKARHFRAKLVACTDNFNKPTYIRLICAVLLVLIVCWEDPKSRRLFRRLLTHSSLYAIVLAIKAGGYQCISVNQLATIGREYTSAHDATVNAVPDREADRLSA